MTYHRYHSALLGLILTAPLTLAGCGPAQDSANTSGASSSVVSGLLVDAPAALADAIKDAKPGDTLVLADGTYSDFEIHFTGEGEANKPITLRAQTPGNVILSGQSDLQMSGEHLVVSGLYFKDGYTPSSQVISFRTSKDALCNNCRVTETVIEDYNQTLRREVDGWVMMYGKNNRFDHNSLIGKRNTGVTMAVRMNTPESRENNHRIDHNYFGPRQILGSNGGETLRIGTSHYSRSDSNTVVENNYFDRADGEVEVISSKSGGNQIRSNVFFESRGTLTLRHGNNAVVEGNVFFGNGVDHTGGIRVINAGQTVRGNYMEGLTGSRFGGGLVVMNGIPNGPINRYDVVENALITENSIIHVDNIQLGAGSDEERYGVPVDSEFTNNLIATKNGEDTFTLYDDMSGIDFNNNILDGEVPEELAQGFEKKTVSLSRAANGLLYPDGLEVGAPRDLTVISKDDVGAPWHTKPAGLVQFGSGETHNVSNGTELFEAAKAAAAGDVIALSTGDYAVTKMVQIDKPLSFIGSGNATIYFEKSALFQIEDGGSLQVKNLTINGAEAPDSTGNSVIRTSPYSMLQNYRLDLDSVDFVDLDVNRSFNIFSASKGTFADTITLNNVSVSDLSGAVLKLDQENDDYGIYNAEYVTITDSSFTDIGMAVLTLYRGGTDESTFGPHLDMTGTTITNAGKNNRNKSGASLWLHGVQVTNMSGNTVTDSAPIIIDHTVGEPKTNISGNTFVAMPDIQVKELNSAFENTAIIENNDVRTK